MLTLNELRARLDGLSPTAVRFVARVVDSLANPPKATVSSPETWLTSSPEWIEYFGLALSVHHGTTTEPLAQKGFEVVFRNACEAADWHVEAAASETQRFLDVVITPPGVGTRKLSLKSTAAKRLSRTTAHISKLTEAAWIQDVRSARDRRNRTQALFQEYSAAVDAIVMLRGFRNGAETPKRYELLEIPTAIFGSLQTMPLEAFSADGPRLDCAWGGEACAAQVSLDRSDAKITVGRIMLSCCTVHAVWDMVRP